jgi:NADH dehydrogenase FAD-containing subunit
MGIYELPKAPFRLIASILTASFSLLYDLVDLAVSNCIHHHHHASKDGKDNRKKVVVVGGSFAGITAARHLAHHSDLFHVTVIEKKNYLEYTPSVFRVLVEPERAETIFAPVLVPGAQIVQGTADKITDTEVFVGNTSYPYDYLILATGSDYIGGIKPTEKENDLHERRSSLVKASQTLAAAKLVTVVGGGYVGVELAADVAWKYPSKEIVMHTDLSRLLQVMPASVSTYVHQWFDTHNIKIITNTSFDIKGYRPAQDELYFPCVGLQIHPVPQIPESNRFFNRSDHIDVRGMVRVSKTMQLTNCPNVFAIGDLMNHECMQEKMAYTAEMNAVAVATNILRLTRGQAAQEYPQMITGTTKAPFVCAISLGKWDGLVLFNDWVVMWGRPAALMKHFIEYTKVDQYRDNWMGKSVWAVAEPVTFFINKLYRAFEQEYAWVSASAITGATAAAAAYLTSGFGFGRK